MDNSVTINCAVWQTATMRDNFENFGGMVCLDAMNRVLNHLSWPYCSISIHNDLEQAYIGCESIICQERDDACEFLLNFTCNSSPLRPLTEIHAVVSDGKFSS